MDRQNRLTILQCVAWRWEPDRVSKDRCGWRRWSCQSRRGILLDAAECAAGRQRLRRVCRRPVREVLRAGDGTAEPGAGNRRLDATDTPIFGYRISSPFAGFV